MSELACRRELFSLPAGLHYLNCAYMAPLPVVAQEAGLAGIRAKANPSAITARDFFDESDRARALFGQLIGGDTGRVAIIPSVSYAVATAARNCPTKAGQNVVVLDEQFPSNVLAWQRLCRERELELRTVRAPASRNRGEAWNAELLTAIDAATAVVALPPAHWTDGTRFDLEAVGRRTRETGALFFIDGTQSIGAAAFDVSRVNADAVACAGYKWLLGPYSVGLAWYGPRFDDGVPLEEGWIARERSEDFRRLVDYPAAYQPGAVRYDVGERSNFILIPMLNAALEVVLDLGPERIQRYCAAITRVAVEEARALGFSVEDAAWRSAHLFGLRAPEGVDLDGLRATLADRNVHVSLRGSAVRVAPHVYNDVADLGALVDALRAAVSGAGTAPASPSDPRAASSPAR